MANCCDVIAFVMTTSTFITAYGQDSCITVLGNLNASSFQVLKEGDFCYNQTCLPNGHGGLELRSVKIGSFNDTRGWQPTSSYRYDYFNSSCFSIHCLPLPGDEVAFLAGDLLALVDEYPDYNADGRILLHSVVAACRELHQQLAQQRSSSP